MRIFDGYILYYPIEIQTGSSTDVGSGPLRAERRRREARREIYTTPGHVTARRSILGPPAEGRPGPSVQKKMISDCGEFFDEH